MLSNNFKENKQQLHTLYLEDSADFYKELFARWLDASTNEAIITEILESLRERRKNIIKSYYLENKT